jgi:hypothetical protein
MTVTGFAKDKDSSTGLPSATVILRTGNVTLASVVAGATGAFSISTTSNATELVISSVGYKTTSYPLPDYINQVNYPLERDAKELDPVIITVNKRHFPWLLGLLLIVAIAKRK